MQPSLQLLWHQTSHAAEQLSSRTPRTPDKNRIILQIKKQWMGTVRCTHNQGQVGHQAQDSPGPLSTSCFLFPVSLWLILLVCLEYLGQAGPLSSLAPLAPAVSRVCQAFSYLLSGLLHYDVSRLRFKVWYHVSAFCSNNVLSKRHCHISDLKR